MGDNRMVEGMQWVFYSGYYELLFQYIDSTGRIVGEVRGSSYEPKRGWEACSVQGGKKIVFGLYTSADAAQAAVAAEYSLSLISAASGLRAAFDPDSAPECRCRFAGDRFDPTDCDLHGNKREAE